MGRSSGTPHSASLCSGDRILPTQPNPTAFLSRSLAFAPKEDNAAGSGAPVIVLGATNRPMDLDKAFLRRMPVQIQTLVPNAEDRVSIFAAKLKVVFAYTA